MFRAEGSSDRSRSGSSPTEKSCTSRTQMHARVKRPAAASERSGVLGICVAWVLIGACNRRSVAPLIDGDDAGVAIVHDTQKPTRLTITLLRSDTLARLDTESVPGWPARPSLGIGWRAIETWHLTLVSGEQVRLQGPAAGAIYLRLRSDLTPLSIESSHQPADRGFGSQVSPCRSSGGVLWSTVTGVAVEEILVGRCDAQ